MRGKSSAKVGAVVVCGAGAAGLAAAISAARCGAPVLLLEAGPRIGGTVANALIHTLAGLYDSSGELLNEGLPCELVERLLGADSRTRLRSMGRLWVLQVCPSVYRQVVQAWIAEEQQITVLYGAQVTRVRREGPRITELTVAASEGISYVRPQAVIDATGTAEVARLLDASLAIDDYPRAAGGWIFRLRGVMAGGLEFPKGLAVVRALREAAQAGALPAECRHTWLDVGLDEDEAFVKLCVPLGEGEQISVSGKDIVTRLRSAQAAIVALLGQFPQFARAEVMQTGELGVRDGGRIRGRYTLTVDDVRAGRKFTDAVCRCSWPIEYWDAQRGVSIEYLPDGKYYEIPMAALQLEGVENFWAVGKCVSADRYAHASARVVGTCWAMGQAAGMSAAAMEDASCVEEHREHEPVRAVSRDSGPAAGPSGGNRPAKERVAVVPRAG